MHQKFKRTIRLNCTIWCFKSKSSFLFEDRRWDKGMNDFWPLLLTVSKYSCDIVWCGQKRPLHFIIISIESWVWEVVIDTLYHYLRDFASCPFWCTIIEVLRIIKMTRFFKNQLLNRLKLLFFTIPLWECAIRSFFLVAGKWSLIMPVSWAWKMQYCLCTSTAIGWSSLPSLVTAVEQFVWLSSTVFEFLPWEHWLLDSIQLLQLP